MSFEQPVRVNRNGMFVGGPKHGEPGPAAGARMHPEYRVHEPMPLTRLPWMPTEAQLDAGAVPPSTESYPMRVYTRREWYTQTAAFTFWVFEGVTDNDANTCARAFCESDIILRLEQAPQYRARLERVRRCDVCLALLNVVTCTRLPFGVSIEVTHMSEMLEHKLTASCRFEWDASTGGMDPAVIQLVQGVDEEEVLVDGRASSLRAAAVIRGVLRGFLLHEIDERITVPGGLTGPHRPFNPHVVYPLRQFHGSAEK